MTIEEYKAFYLRHLKETILPFWVDRAVDEEYGGVYTCFDNRGETLNSTDKYVWSQGRAAWVFARLSEMEAFDYASRARFQKIAGNTAEFLYAHCLLDNGNAAFLLTREGAKKEPVPGGGYDTSIYADCFVALGMSRYAKASGERRFKDFADRCFSSALGRVGSGCYRSDPYPVPNGYIPHGLDMIFMHTARELGWHELAKLSMERVFGRFYDGKYIREFVPADGGFDDAAMLGRYINPGHTLECMWFALDVARDLEDKSAMKRSLDVVRSTLETGWDHEYGGLFLFSDKKSGKPGGTTSEPDEPMVRKVLSDWDCKLWWVHSEALYVTLYAYTVSRDSFFLEWHKRISDYTFKTFPNPDASVGEWVNVCTRDGKPEDKVIALPVKDPYHTARDLILLSELNA